MRRVARFSPWLNEATRDMVRRPTPTPTSNPSVLLLLLLLFMFGHKMRAASRTGWASGCGCGLRGAPLIMQCPTGTEKASETRRLAPVSSSGGGSWPLTTYNLHISLIFQCIIKNAFNANRKILKALFLINCFMRHEPCGRIANCCGHGILRMAI